MHDQLTLQPGAGTSAPAAPAGPESPVVTRWSGREASALRRALRMTNVEFAAHLGVAERTVVYWNTRDGRVLVPELQRALDTVLAHAAAPARQRFTLALAGAR